MRMPVLGEINTRPTTGFELRPLCVRSGSFAGYPGRSIATPKLWHNLAYAGLQVVLVLAFQYPCFEKVRRCVHDSLITEEISSWMSQRMHQPLRLNYDATDTKRCRSGQNVADQLPFVFLSFC